MSSFWRYFGGHDNIRDKSPVLISLNHEIEKPSTKNSPLLSLVIVTRGYSFINILQLAIQKMFLVGQHLPVFSAAVRVVICRDVNTFFPSQSSLLQFDNALLRDELLVNIVASVVFFAVLEIKITNLFLGFLQSCIAVKFGVVLRVRERNSLLVLTVQGCWCLLSAISVGSLGLERTILVDVLLEVEREQDDEVDLFGGLVPEHVSELM